MLAINWSPEGWQKKQKYLRTLDLAWIYKVMDGSLKKNCPSTRKYKRTIICSMTSFGVFFISLKWPSSVFLKYLNRFFLEYKWSLIRMVPGVIQLTKTFKPHLRSILPQSYRQGVSEEKWMPAWLVVRAYEGMWMPALTIGCHSYWDLRSYQCHVLNVLSYWSCTSSRY